MYKFISPRPVSIKLVSPSCLFSLNRHNLKPDQNSHIWIESRSSHKLYADNCLSLLFNIQHIPSVVSARKIAMPEALALARTDLELYYRSKCRQKRPRTPFAGIWTSQEDVGTALPASSRMIENQLHSTSVAENQVCGNLKMISRYGYTRFRGPQRHALWAMAYHPSSSRDMSSCVRMLGPCKQSSLGWSQKEVFYGLMSCAKTSSSQRIDRGMCNEVASKTRCCRSSKFFRTEK